MNLKRFDIPFLRNVSETIVTRVLLIIVGLVSSVLVARVLGPEGRGLFAIAGTIGAIGIQFGNLGIHSSNTYYVARDRTLLPTLLGNSLIVGLGIGMVAAVVAFLIFVCYPGIAPLDGTILLLALLWIPFGLLYLLLQNLMIGIEQIRFYNVTELITKVLYTLAIAFLVLFGQVSVEFVYTIVIATGLAGVVVLLWRLIRLAGAWKSSFYVFRRSFSFGVKAYFVALFSFLVMRIDLLMVEFYLGLDATGHYSIAITLADYLYMIPVVVGTILFPKLSGMRGLREKWIYTKRLMLFFTPAMVLLCLFAALLARPSVLLLFGKEFEAAVAAFLWLIPAVLCLSLNTVFMNYFASLGMPLITLYSTIIAVALNIALNVWLLPKYGIIGASISSIVAYGTMLAVSVTYIYWKKPFYEPEVQYET